MKKYARLKQETKLVYRHGSFEWPLTLPAGLQCVEIDRGGTAGKYFLDEFPPDIFPFNSILRHEAEHYGIVLEPEQVRPYGQDDFLCLVRGTVNGNLYQLRSKYKLSKGTPFRVDGPYDKNGLVVKCEYKPHEVQS